MSSASYPSPADSAKEAFEPTTIKLKRLSAAFTTLINTRDFDIVSPESRELVSYLSNDWTASMDTQPAKVSWPDQLVLWRERAEEMPDVKFEVVHVECDMHERKGVADVWVDMEVSGMGDVKLSAVNEVKWRRQQGVWKCFHTRGMRGSTMNSGGLV